MVEASLFRHPSYWVKSEKVNSSEHFNQNHEKLHQYFSLVQTKWFMWKK